MPSKRESSYLTQILPGKSSTSPKSQSYLCSALSLHGDLAVVGRRLIGCLALQSMTRSVHSLKKVVGVHGGPAQLLEIVQAAIKQVSCNMLCASTMVQQRHDIP